MTEKLLELVNDKEKNLLLVKLFLATLQLRAWPHGSTISFHVFNSVLASVKIINCNTFLLGKNSD